MADQDDILPQQSPEERAKSKLIDPTPQRKKFVIELLYKFLTNQISYSQLAGIPQKDLFVLAEMGHIKLIHGRLEEAKKIFDCLVKIDHKNPLYHANLGSIAQKSSKFVDAVYEYSEALKLKKDDVPSLVNRGEIYLIHKNFKKAAEDFRSAILLDPLGKNKYANRARSLVIAIKRSLQLAKEKPAASRLPKGPASPRIPSARPAAPRLPSPGIGRGPVRPK